PTARRAFATNRSMAPSSRPPWLEAEVPAGFQTGRPLQATSCTELVRDGQNPPGKMCSAIPATACVTHLTFRYLLPTDSGATITFSVGRIPRMAERLAVLIPAPGPARAAPLLLRQSWRAFKHSLIRRL